MTNFNYFPDIPAADHNPSVDQPNMQTNAQSIKDLIAVDHVTFSVNNGGQHTSISFNQDASYVPTPPVSPPELFTNAVTLIGNPQLFYFSGNAAHSSDQYSLFATKGSTMLLGGIIVKWFVATLTGPTTPFTFMGLSINDFPTGIFGANITTKDIDYTVGYNALSTSGITITRKPGAGINNDVFVTVLGY